MQLFHRPANRDRAVDESEKQFSKSLYEFWMCVKAKDEEGIIRRA